MLKAILAVIVAATGCAQPTRDQLSHMQASCVVEHYGHRNTFRCRLDDESAVGYWNRWKITIYGSGIEWMSQPRIADWIREEVMQDGSLEHSSLLWGTIDVVPYDSAIRQYFMGVWSKGSAFETRPQNIAGVAIMGGIEIWFDEPVSETNGLSTPTPAWLARHQDAVLRWGGTH